LRRRKTCSSAAVRASAGGRGEGGGLSNSEKDNCIDKSIDTTNRRADGQTGGQTDKRTDRQTYKQRDRPLKVEAAWRRVTWTPSPMLWVIPVMYSSEQTNIHGDRQIDKHTNRQTDRHTDRQTLEGGGGVKARDVDAVADAVGDPRDVLLQLQAGFLQSYLA
jgi:hypothetical protein